MILPIGHGGPAFDIATQAPQHAVSRAMRVSRTPDFQVLKNSLGEILQDLDRCVADALSRLVIQDAKDSDVDPATRANGNAGIEAIAGPPLAIPFVPELYMFEKIIDHGDGELGRSSFAQRRIGIGRMKDILTQAGRPRNSRTAEPEPV